MSRFRPVYAKPKEGCFGHFNNCVHICEKWKDCLKTYHTSINLDKVC